MKNSVIVVMALNLTASAINNQKVRTKPADSTSDLSIFASNLQSVQDQAKDSSAATFSECGEEMFDMIGSTCADNTDCNGSTFCCSKGRCVPGSICYKGQKQAYDHCEYGFECLSRCCSANSCSPVIQCVKTCA